MDSLLGIVHCPPPRTHLLSESGTVTPFKTRTTSTCSNLTTSSRNTLMTSMHIHLLSFPQFVSPALQLCVFGRGKFLSEHPLTLRCRPARATLARTSSDIIPTANSRVRSLYTPSLANAFYPNRASSCHAGMQAGPGVHSSEGCLSPERVMLQVCHYSCLTSPSYRLCHQSCHIDTQHSRERCKVAR